MMWMACFRRDAMDNIYETAATMASLHCEEAWCGLD
jgi:hypothetical protein